MAEDTGQDKTEEPTEKRLTDARKKGQIPRSKELNTFVILMAGSSSLFLFGEQMASGLKNIMREQFQLSRQVIFDPTATVIYFQRVMMEGLFLVAPLMLIMTIAAIVAPLALGGWNFSLSSLQPKFEKLDPIKGIPRLFAVRGLVELLKSILKFFLIFSVVILLYHLYFNHFVKLGFEPQNQAIIHAVNIIAKSFILLSASLILVVIFDAPFQLWDHHRKLKMTKQEVRDEMKETEGSPEIKGKIRQLQMEMAQRRMMDEVPKADVIVTNPSHFAIALRYDQQSSAAPKLVAKGTDLVAAQIRNLAIKADIPLVAAPPVARALYYSTDLGKEIPQGLFLAVAQVLAYVFQLKIARENNWDEPLPPVNLSVPGEFKQE
jgi:flagellar biosynthetic protein FlhB